MTLNPGPAQVLTIRVLWLCIGHEVLIELLNTPQDPRG